MLLHIDRSINMKPGSPGHLDANLMWEILDLHASIGVLLRKKYNGLNGYELVVLLAICRSKEPPTIGQIAELLAVTSQYASQVTSRLVERGFVSVEPGETDRRRKVVLLTELGREICDMRLVFDENHHEKSDAGKTRQAVESVREEVDRAMRALAAERQADQAS